MGREFQWASLLLSMPQVLHIENLGDSGIDLKIRFNFYLVKEIPANLSRLRMVPSFK